MLMCVPHKTFGRRHAYETTQKNYNVPIIFVAHSLGGLVVKQALVIAKNDDTYSNIRKATNSLVFFAVPHQGGHGAGLGAIAKNIVLSLTGDANNDLIESLKSNSLFQEHQTAFFKHQLEDYHVVSVCEDKPTKLTRIFGNATALVIYRSAGLILMAHLADKYCRLLSMKNLRLWDCQALGRRY